VFDLLKILASDQRALVIADGAAFGSQMGRVHRLMMEREGICLYLPESFEWLILSAGVLKGHGIDAILGAPYDYVDANDFFSWERFFTALLTDMSADTRMRYSKAKLNPVFLQPFCRDRIISVLPEAVRDALIGD